MFTDPVKNIRALGLKENDIVADLGAGTGFYSVLAGHVAHRGKVYAVDIIKDFLSVMAKKVKEARLPNVEVLWGDIEKLGGTKIKDNIVDVVIASNVLSQVGDKHQFIEEIKRMLRPKGRVLLIDWSLDSIVVGIKMIVPKNRALEMFAKKGFIVERDINVGDHHYGMILIKN